MQKFWQTLRWPPRRLVLWHSIAAIPMATVVILGAYLSYHYHQLTIQNRDRVDRAYEVLDVVDGLFISVQNADVAQRDFIITGDGAHLAVFQAALKDENADSGSSRRCLRPAPSRRRTWPRSTRPSPRSWPNSAGRSRCASSRASTPRSRPSATATTAPP